MRQCWGNCLVCKLLLWRQEGGPSLVSRTYLKSSLTDVQSQCWEMKRGNSLLLDSLDYGKNLSFKTRWLWSHLFCTWQHATLVNSPQFWLSIQDLTLTSMDDVHNTPFLVVKLQAANGWQRILSQFYSGVVPSRLPLTEWIILHPCVYRKHQLVTFT